MVESMLPATAPVGPGLWEKGTLDDSPKVGDLWVTSWDGTDLGLVVLSAIRETHILVWPVTDEAVAPSAPCIRLEANWLIEPLVCWPEAEAGVSFATLDRRLGHILDSRVMRLVYDSLRGGDPVDNVQTYPDREDDAAVDALTEVVDFACSLSDRDWPDLGHEGVLSQDFLASKSVTARALSPFFDGGPAVVAQAFNQRRLVNRATARAIASQFDVDWASVLEPPSGLEASLLRQPQVKHRLSNLARSRSVTEEQIRSEVWMTSLQAARQELGDATDAARERVEAAIARLEAEA